MNESRARLLSLRDDSLPALTTILGPDALEMLRASGPIASARLTQVSWTPGRALSATFATNTPTPRGRQSQDGHIVAYTNAAGELPGGLQLEDTDGSRVALWPLANDPSLPGLATVLQPAAARKLLDGLDAPRGAVTPRLRAYRPGRRAVVELTLPRQRLFAKVVPPVSVARLQALHAQMAQELPVPRSHGWSASHGLVVLQALPGLSLRQCLLDTRLSLPDPVQISQLLARLPAPADGRTAPSQAAGALELATLLRRLTPDCESAIDTLLKAFKSDRPSRPELPVHGDLHEAQLTVQAGMITGILDIDTAGLGERIDDWATLLGHLAVLREAVPPVPRQRIEKWALRAMALADSECGDPVRLRLRIAAVIFGLATGPFRVQSPAWVEETRARIRLAETWLQNAGSHIKDEKLLSHA